MRPIAQTLDPRTLIAKAEASAARLRHHDAICTTCSALEDPATSTCERRDQLRRQLRACRALLSAVRTPSPTR